MWVAVVLGVLVGANVARADRAFTPRFSTNDTGAITMAANTVLTCPASDTKCAPAQKGGSASNNTFRMGYVDVDTDAATFDSSRAALRLPSGATVLYAALYWGANTATAPGGAAARDPAARGRVLLATPESAGYRPVMAATVDRGAATSQKDAYQGFADVTSLVRAAGAGDYTVADVQSGTGEDRYAGWALVVAYRDRTAPARNLTLFDGFISINSGDAPREVVVEGFKAPRSGPVHASLGEVAYEGDRSLGGDSAAFDATALSDARNPSTNSFNSTITHRGTPETGRTPDYDNQLGFDADVFDASGIVRNGATSAALKFQTGGDTYLPGVVFVAIDIYAPDVVVAEVRGRPQRRPGRAGRRARVHDHRAQQRPGRGARPRAHRPAAQRDDARPRVAGGAAKRVRRTAAPRRPTPTRASSTRRRSRSSCAWARTRAQSPAGAWHRARRSPCASASACATERRRAP